MIKLRKKPNFFWLNFFTEILLFRSCQILAWKMVQLGVLPDDNIYKFLKIYIMLLKQTVVSYDIAIYIHKYLQNNSRYTNNNNFLSLFVKKDLLKL